MRDYCIIVLYSEVANFFQNSGLQTNWPLVYYENGLNVYFMERDSSIGDASPSIWSCRSHVLNIF